MSQRNGREKGDMWEPFCFYYRPSYDQPQSKMNSNHKQKAQLVVLQGI